MQHRLLWRILTRKRDILMTLSRLSVVVLLLCMALVACENNDIDLQPSAPPDDNILSTDDALPTPTREGAPAEPTTTADQAGTGGEPLTLAGEGFAVEVAGADNIIFRGDGYVGCENGLLALRPNAQGLQQATLLLPPDVTTGQYSIGSSGAADVAATLSLADNRVFAGNVGGVLILEAFGTQTDDAIIGNFAFSASNGSALVEVQGLFDFSLAADIGACG